MNKRRSTLAGLPRALRASPHHWRAQPTKQWRVAIVANNTSPAFEALLGNVRNELARLGYVEGQNIAYEFRHVGGQLVAIKVVASQQRPGACASPMRFSSAPTA